MYTIFFLTILLTQTMIPIPPHTQQKIENYKMQWRHDYLQLKPLHNISNNKQVDAETNLSRSKRYLAMVISIECGKLLKKVI